MCGYLFERTWKIGLTRTGDESGLRLESIPLVDRSRRPLSLTVLSYPEKPDFRHEITRRDLFERTLFSKRTNHE